MIRSHINARIFFYLSLGLPPAVTCAQGAPQGPPAVQKQDAQSQAENAGGVILPEPLGGFSPRLTGFGESAAKQANLLSGSIGVRGLYTDNAFTSGIRTVDDYQYSILPSIGFRTFGQHTQWTVNYEGGVTIDQRLQANSQQSHGAAVDVAHQFTPRLASEFRQDFARTNNPFVQIGASESLPTVAGPGQLSNFAVPAPVTRIGSISSANAAYQLSQHSAVGVSGSFSLLDFRNDQLLVGAGGSLIDTTNTTGRLFYLRQISAHQTIGAEYQLQGLRFEGGAARTIDQTVYLFDGIAFRAGMSLSFYAGPERTHTHDIILSLPGIGPTVRPGVSDVWSLGGGVAFAWRTLRNGIRVAADRGVTDGGGWAGAVRMTAARVELEKALSLRWTSTLQLSYSDGRIVAVPSNFPADRITTEEGAIGLQCRITRGLFTTAQYARIQQPHTGAFTHAIQNNHNQLQVGFTYQFNKVFSQ
jgi:hypothetical protein